MASEAYFPVGGIRYLKRQYRARIAEMKRARKPPKSTRFCNGIADPGDVDGIDAYIALLAADAAQKKTAR